jgi:ABC-type Fe3+ transport system permease subunit
MVKLDREKFLLCFLAVVLTFFIAGLLLSLVLQSTSITWERTASRRRPAFSSHLVTTVWGSLITCLILLCDSSSALNWQTPTK